LSVRSLKAMYRIIYLHTDHLGIQGRPLPPIPIGIRLSLIELLSARELSWLADGPAAKINASNIRRSAYAYLFIAGTALRDIPRDEESG
ncbi:MAG: hypothetical protein ACE14P_15305, partial [Methanotrichaceae archaeon]